MHALGKFLRSLLILSASHACARTPTAPGAELSVQLGAEKVTLRSEPYLSLQENSAVVSIEHSGTAVFITIPDTFWGTETVPIGDSVGANATLWASLGGAPVVARGGTLRLILNDAVPGGHFEAVVVDAATPSMGGQPELTVSGMIKGTWKK